MITALVILFLKTNNPKIAGVQQQQYSTEDREKFISSVHAADTSTNDYHKHEELTFSYPTVGIPVPGNKYNSTKVAEKDLAAFDEELLRILKPFNVLLPRLRTPTASSRGTETWTPSTPAERAATSSAKTS